MNCSYSDLLCDSVFVEECRKSYKQLVYRLTYAMRLVHYNLLTRHNRKNMSETAFFVRSDVNQQLGDQLINKKGK